MDIVRLSSPSDDAPSTIRKRSLTMRHVIGKHDNGEEGQSWDVRTHPSSILLSLALAASIFLFGGSAASAKPKDKPPKEHPKSYAVPEPASILLLGASMATIGGVLWYRFRDRNRRTH